MQLTVGCSFVGDAGDQDEFELRQLYRLLEEHGLRPSPGPGSAKVGQKSLGLGEAFEIANIALTAIGTLIAVLAFWRASRPSYTVTVKSGQTTWTVSGTSQEQVSDEVRRLAVEQPQAQIAIEVTRDTKA